MDNDNINPSHDEDNTISDQEWIFDNKANAAAALAEKLADAYTPGFLQAEFNPEEAKLAGAFVEDALNEQDAIESNIDLMDLIEEMVPANTVEVTKTEGED